MIDKIDFKIWLENPMTKNFIKLLELQAEEYKKSAADIMQESYYKNEKPEIATLYFGKADGALTVAGLLERMRQQTILESKQEEGLIVEDYIINFLNLENETDK